MHKVVTGWGLDNHLVSDAAAVDGLANARCTWWLRVPRTKCHVRCNIVVISRIAGERASNVDTRGWAVKNFAGWAVVLPVECADGWAEQVSYPDLDLLIEPPWFDPTQSGLRLVANCGGATTIDSKYPRAELRETRRWSTGLGTHQLSVWGHCDALPSVRPRVVIAQIHDDFDALVEILVDGMTSSSDGLVRVAMRVGGSDDVTVLEECYRLGDTYRLSIGVEAHHLSVSFNDRQVSAHLPQQSRCYFATGAHVQSNLGDGDSPDAVGAVTIADVVVTHG